MKQLGNLLIEKGISKTLFDAMELLGRNALELALSSFFIIRYSSPIHLEIGLDFFVRVYP